MELKLGQEVKVSVEKTLDHFIKPVTSTSNLMGGQPGTRIIAAHYGVNDGDKVAEYVLPTNIMQKRPTDATFKAGTAASFGDTTVSTQTWGLKKYWIFSKLPPSLFTSQVGITNKDPQNLLDGVSQSLLNPVVDAFKIPLNKEFYLHAFFSNTALDFSANFASNTFDSGDITETSLKENTGFVKLIGDGITAGTVKNYKTTSNTGGVDLDGTALTGAQALVYVDAIIDQAPVKLRNYNKSEGIPMRPKILLSDNLYTAFEKYIISQGFGADRGLRFFAQTPTGQIDINKPLGILYRGYQVYEMSGVFDDYWLKTDPAKDKNHMGLMVAPDNLSIGFNLRNPLGGENYGLRLYRSPETEKGGFYDLSIYIELDYIIKDLSLVSSLGFEQNFTGA